MKKHVVKAFAGVVAAAAMVLIPVGDLFAEPATPTLIAPQELEQAVPEIFAAPIAEETEEVVMPEVLTASEETQNNPLREIFVNADKVPVFEAPGLEAPISFLSKADSAFLLNRGDSWTEIVMENGLRGYIENAYVSETPTREAVIPVNRDQDRDYAREEKVQKVLEMAKSRLGSPYVYGSTGPNSFDCSGFTTYTFRNSIGMSLERTSRDQSQMGTKVSRENLQAGDLLFFDTNGGLNNVTHVGIYIGGGQFIHASSGVYRKVVISDLNEGYYTDRYMWARRVID